MLPPPPALAVNREFWVSRSSVSYTDLLRRYSSILVEYSNAMVLRCVDTASTRPNESSKLASRGSTTEDDFWPPSPGHGQAQEELFCFRAHGSRSAVPVSERRPRPPSSRQNTEKMVNDPDSYDARPNISRWPPATLSFDKTGTRHRWFISVCTSMKSRKTFDE